MPMWREVCNYLEALNYARAEIAKADGLPVSIRLLDEAHQRLMHGVRGATKQPGEVRRSQNWIGGSRPGNAVYVPPPAQSLPDLLGALEKYMHVEKRPACSGADSSGPCVQFESIHPYLDGNGRIGRLLIGLLMEHWGLLKAPLLYLSLFFKRHREEYYRRLNLVRTEGDWEGWTDFFLDGVATIADEAVASAARSLRRGNFGSRPRAGSGHNLGVCGAAVRALAEPSDHHRSGYDEAYQDQQTHGDTCDRDAGRCQHSRRDDGKEARSQLCLSGLH